MFVKKYLKLLREPSLTNPLKSRDAFGYLEFAQKVVGWKGPPKGSSYYYLYKLWTCFIMALTAFYTPIGLVISYFKEFENLTPNEFLTSVQLGFNIPGASIKGVMQFTNLWRYEKFKDHLDIMDKSCTRDDEVLRIHRLVNRCNSIYLFYQTLFVFYPITTFLTGVYLGKSQWLVYNPFIDWRESTGKLWLSSFIEYIAVANACYFNLVGDVNLVVYGMVMCLHINMLQDRVHRLRTDPEKSEQQNYDELIQCVIDHKMILEYFEIMRPLASNLIFVQFLIIGGVLGFSALNVLYFWKWLTGMSTLVYITGCLLQTFPFCYVCNVIAEDCETLANSIFHSNWIDATKSYKATLAYFLLNVQRSIGFTAGGIFPVCLNTNISVAKFAFSVVTIVNQMHLMDKLQQD